MKKLNISKKETASGERESRRIGLRGKLFAVVFLGIVVGFAAIIALQSVQERDRLRQFVAEGNVELTRMLASQLGGAVRFGRVDKTREVYDAMVAEESSSIATIKVVRGSDEPLVDFVSPTLAATDESAIEKALADAIEKNELVTLRAAGQQIVVAPTTYGSGADTVGFVAVAWDFARADSEIAESAVSTALIAAGIAAAFLIAMALCISRLVTDPIQRLNRRIASLAEGDNTVEIPYQSRGDEVGAIARSIEIFKRNAIEKVELEEKQHQAEARAEHERKQAMRDLADQFEEAVGNIVHAVSNAATELQAAAETMTMTVDETNNRSAAVASASEQASVNVQTVASAAEEMSSSIREIGRQASESSSRAGTAEREADETVTTVQQLSETAERIGEVVALIQEIAEQTNLLALNATIEAARAGEAGKGFAVVASEVKTLASQTAKATTDIAAQIQAIQSATGTSAAAIARVTGAVKELSGIAATIASAVEEQTAVTQDIAQNVQQAAAGTQDVSSNITGVTQAATESSSAASQVLTSAGDLAQQASALNSEIDSFLSRVRVAAA